MAELSADAKDLIDRPVFAHVATLMPDGSPQVSPVWIDHEGDDVLINTAEGRLKADNLRADGRVAISITDPDNPYANLLIRGRVKEMTHEGADENIDALAKKYLGEDEYPFRQPGEVRVKVLIEPEKVAAPQG